MSTDEKDKLQEISQVSLYSAGVMPASIRYCFRILQRHLQGENLLEMGLAEGVMTELLATTGKSMTVVEGSALFLRDLRQRFPQAEVVHALFEGLSRRIDSTSLSWAMSSSMCRIQCKSFLGRAAGSSRVVESLPQCLTPTRSTARQRCSWACCLGKTHSTGWTCTMATAAYSIRNSSGLSLSKPA